MNLDLAIVMTPGENLAVSWIYNLSVTSSTLGHLHLDWMPFTKYNCNSSAVFDFNLTFQKSMLSSSTWKLPSDSVVMTTISLTLTKSRTESKKALGQTLRSLELETKKWPHQRYGLPKLHGWPYIEAGHIRLPEKALHSK